MTRRRLIAIAAVFGLVLGLGVVWLVGTVSAGRTGVATFVDGPGSSGGLGTPPPGRTGQPTTRAPQPSVTATTRQPPTARGSRTRPSSPAPSSGGPATTDAAPSPVRTVRVSGPLGGGPMDDSCRFFANPFDVSLTVRSVVLAAADPGLVLDDEHCPAGSFGSVVKELGPCRPGVAVVPDGACYTGVQLVAAKRLPPGSGEPFQEYTARVALGFTTRCVAADVTPCSRDEVARLAPSDDRPVVVEWTPLSDPLRTYGRRAGPTGSPPA